MNKEQAASELGMTVRTLQRHMAAHRIGFAMRRTATGEEATFSDEEVARFRIEREALTETVTPAMLSVSERVTPDAITTKEQGNTAQNALQRAPSEQSMQAFALMVADALQGSQAPKMLLSLTDAAEVSGLSASHLLKAIHAGTLDGRKIGRGFKVRPSDLHEYAKQVWNEAPEYKKPEAKQLGNGLKVKGKR
jgi:excisionase family DNA binding protein